VPRDLSFILQDLPAAPASGGFMERLKARQFVSYMLQTPAQPPDSSPAASNHPAGPGASLTNLFMPGRMP